MHTDPVLITLRRLTLALSCALALTVVGVVNAPPSEAASWQTRCVDAREMRTFPSSTSKRAYSTKVYFGQTVYADRKPHGRYRVTWRVGINPWHRAWISAKPKYTSRGQCGTIT